MMTMSEQMDPRWPKVLSHSVHELVNAIAPGVGFLGMALKERMGPLSEKQRQVLQEVEKSFGRVKALAEEMSELSSLEKGQLTYNWQPTDVRDAIRIAAAQLPPLPQREVAIDLQLGEGPAMVSADRKRLVQAFTSVLAALRRAIVNEPLTVCETTSGHAGIFEVHIGDADARAALASGQERPVFYEWRGNEGLSLIIARRLIELHGGQIVAPPGDRIDGPGDGIVEPRGAQKAGVAVTLPLS